MMMRQVNEDRDPPTLNQALPTGLVWSILGRGGASVEGMVLQVEDFVVVGPLDQMRVSPLRNWCSSSSFWVFGGARPLLVVC